MLPEPIQPVEPIGPEEPIPDLPRIAEAQGPIAAITTIAARSRSARLAWKERGVAPLGYIKGMALVFARVYLKLRAGDAAATDMARANSGDTATDALAYYTDVFAATSMSNAIDGADTLRHLFVLLIGLGMRESSGIYCVGRDVTSSNATGDTSEAGLFQATFNSRTASPLLTKLFQDYLADPSGFVEVFKEGVRCTAANLESFGGGEGAAFQQLSKACPAFAVEYAAVGLRHIRKHWGAIIRKEAEVRPECDAMLQQVQSFVDMSPDISKVLVN
jgi:hypothetical protein